MTTHRKNYFSNKAITKAFAEIASLDSTEYTDPSFDPTTILIQLARANTLLDSKKSKIFMETLSSLRNKSACERAAESFDSDYWVNVPLSWESTLELLNEVIAVCKLFNTNIPDSWLNLTNYDMDSSTLEEEEYSTSRTQVRV